MAGVVVTPSFQKRDPLSLMSARGPMPRVPRVMIVSRITALFAMAALIGCDREKPTVEAATSAASAPAPAGTTSVPAPPAALSADACPATGLWAICSVEKRLRQSGFVARRVEGDSPKRPGFGVRSLAYKMGSGRLELFFYPDERALAKDMAAIDTVIVAPPGTASPWESPPILIRSANLAAVFLTSNARQAERLTLALTAGAPQPSPR